MIKRLLLAMVLSINYSYAAGYEPQDYIHAFKSETLPKQIRMAYSLEWSGLSSGEIFDLVKRNIDVYINVPLDQELEEYVMSLIRALGYSGNTSYKEFLKNISLTATNRHFRNYAKAALRDLDKHMLWNNMILPKQWPEFPYISREELELNMINSGVPELQLHAAMNNYEKRGASDEFLSALKQGVEMKYLNDLNKHEVEAVAWMCKVMAFSENQKFIKFVEVVANTAPNKKLKSYTSGYLEKLK